MQVPKSQKSTVIFIYVLCLQNYSWHSSWKTNDLRLTVLLKQPVDLKTQI